MSRKRIRLDALECAISAMLVNYQRSKMLNWTYCFDDSFRFLTVIIQHGVFRIRVRKIDQLCLDHAIQIPAVIQPNQTHLEPMRGRLLQNVRVLFERIIVGGLFGG